MEDRNAMIAQIKASCSKPKEPTANVADSTNPTTEKPISKPPSSTLPDNPL